MKRYKIVQLGIGGFKIHQVMNKKGDVIIWDGIFQSRIDAIAFLKSEAGLTSINLETSFLAHRGH